MGRQVDRDPGPVHRHEAGIAQRPTAGRHRPSEHTGHDVGGSVADEDGPVEDRPVRVVGAAVCIDVRDERSDRPPRVPRPDDEVVPEVQPVQVTHRRPLRPRGGQVQ